jgi:outer membrane protein TolC
MSRAKLEIARRGLRATVTKAYYSLVLAQRKYASAQEARDQAANFLKLTQALEQHGQAPHSDVIKAQVAYGQQDTTFDDARLGMDTSRIDLAVLIFPTLNENFTVVDDLDSPKALPAFPEIENMASRDNPELRVALEATRQASLDVRAAKNAYLPTLTVETDYGIEANEFALRGIQTAFPEAGVLPNYGYFLQAVLNVPVWDWGTLRSRVKQAEYRQQASRADLNQRQRELMGQLYSAYNEAAVARDAVDKLRETATLAAESLRLATLRYQGGITTVLDVVDAQTTLTQARNAYNDGQVRYRTALTALQTLTGSF